MGALLQSVKKLERNIVIVKKSTVSDVAAVIEAYLSAQGWRVIEKRANSVQTRLVKAENRQKTSLAWLRTREPQVVLWEIGEKPEGVVVETSFAFTPGFETFLHSLFFLLFFNLVSFAAILHLAMGQSTQGAKLWASACFGIVMLMLALFGWICNSSRYQALLNGFYHEVHEETGHRPQLIADCLLAPAVQMILLYGVAILLVVALFFLWEKSAGHI